MKGKLMNENWYKISKKSLENINILDLLERIL